MLVVSQSWALDEGSNVLAFDKTGELLWTFDGTYGAPLLRADGDERVFVCDFEDAIPLEDTDPEIWTVDEAVVTFTEETWTLRVYR